MPIVWNGLDAGLKPGLADVLTSVIDPLPFTYSVQQGLRTIAQQNALWQEGRNSAGQIVGDTVTNAKGGQSPHNYGLAIDVYPIVNGKLDWGFDGSASQPTAAALPAWQTLWDAVAAAGLVSGKDFRLSSGYDPGHIEVASWHQYISAPLDASISGDGGASAPTSADGDTPTDGPSAPPSLATTIQNWFELDPGVTIGFAAIVGLFVMLGLKRRRLRPARAA
jgi:hypothetical protein